MMARPRSRKKPLIVPEWKMLIEEIKAVRATGAQPAGVVVDIREWAALKKQPGARAVCGYWPGGEETFDGVPVIVRRGVECVRVCAFQDDLNDLLLP